MTFKITCHWSKGKFVLGSPGSHLCWPPLIFSTLDKAVDKARNMGATTVTLVV